MKEWNFQTSIPTKESVPAGEEPSQELKEFCDNLDRNSSEMFVKIKADITKWLGQKFDHLESSSSKTGSSLTVSSEWIAMSSQKSFVIPSSQQEITSEILDYASAPYKIININDLLPKNVYFATDKNINYLYVPLNFFVNKNDRTKIIPHSDMFN